MLRKVESVYYPPAIHVSFSRSSKTNTPLEVANLEKSSPSKVPPLLATLQK